MSGNTASLTGGGIANVSNSPGNQDEFITNIRNSTISGNTAQFGGGIGNARNMTIAGSTVANNRSTDFGGGIVNVGRDIASLNEADITLTNVLLSGNSSDQNGPEIGSLGILRFQGGNLVGASGNAGLTQNFEGILAQGTVIGSFITPTVPVNQIITGLGDFGGITRTHNLVQGSPAINAGINTGLDTDQRGAPHPVGGAFDIGAVEFGSTAPPIPLPPAAPTPPPPSPVTPPTSGGGTPQTPSNFFRLPDSASRDLYSVPSAQRSFNRDLLGRGGNTNVELGQSSRLPNYAGVSGTGWRRSNLFVIDNDVTVELPDGTIRTSFNLYNLTRAAAAVLIYDSSGNLVNVRPVASHRPATGLFAPQQTFINDLREGFFGEFGFWDPRKTSASQVTTLENIDIPPGGKLSITHQGREAGVFADFEIAISAAELAISELIKDSLPTSLSGLTRNERTAVKSALKVANKAMWEAVSETFVNGGQLPSTRNLFNIGYEAMVDEFNSSLTKVGYSLLSRIATRYGIGLVGVGSPVGMLIVADEFAGRVSTIEDLLSSNIQSGNLRWSSSYQPHILYNSLGGLHDISGL